MATYQTPTVFLRDAPTIPAGGTSTGQYPLHSFYPSDYMPDVTMYVKPSDTYKIPLSNAADSTQNGNSGGTQTSVNYAGTVSSADPDPDQANSSQGGNQSNGSLWTAFVDDDDSSWDDRETTWFFFADSGARSVRVYIKMVELNSLTHNLGGSNIVEQGNNVVFTANSISGLEPPSGNHGNRLYLHVRDSNGNVVFTTGSSGLTWSSGSTSAIGKVSTTSTSVTLTVGSSMPAGNYVCHIGHYGGAGSWVQNETDGKVTNPFYGSANQLRTVNFTVSAPTTGPNAFDSGLGPDVGPVPRGSLVTSNSFTVAGISGGTGFATASAETSEIANTFSSSTTPPEGLGSPRVSVNGGSFNNQNAQVQNGDSVRMRFFSNGTQFNKTRFGRLDINGVQGFFNATTEAFLGESASGTTSGSGGAYGLQITGGANNDKVILGPNIKSSHLITTGTVSVNAGATSAAITVEGLTASNTDTVGVLILPTTAETAFVGFQLEVIRGSGSFTVKDYRVSGSAISFRYYALRY